MAKTPPSGAASGLLTVTGADILAAAGRYRGNPYLFGGWGPPPRPWDCSGFVGYVLAHDLKMTLPGGIRWPYSFHPSPAAAYKVWGNAANVPSPAAGDLCCWLTHIGFYAGGGKMLSAFDTQVGTNITAVTGPPGEPLTFRRINTVGASMPPSAVNPLAAASGCLSGAGLLPLLMVRGVIGRARDHRP